jgi:hypothetical protein
MLAAALPRRLGRDTMSLSRQLSRGTMSLLSHAARPESGSTIEAVMCGRSQDLRPESGCTCIISVYNG